MTKHPAPKKPPLVAVTWDDAHSTDAWTDVEKLDREPHRCRSVGYLVHRGRMWSVAGTISRDGQACCVIHVPRGWIVSWRLLR